MHVDSAIAYFFYTLLLNVHVIARSYSTLLKNGKEDGTKLNLIRKPRLPQFSRDYSELLISAVIERSFIDDELYLAMIFMGHKAVRYMQQMPFLWINTSESTLRSWKVVTETWSSNDKVDYSDSGITCAFNVSVEQKYIEYKSEARWLPDASTVNSGFNQNIKVLRCRLSFDTYIFRKRRSKDKLSVMLARNELKIFEFEVPWASRSTGYGVNLYRKLSSWDPWIPNYNQQNNIFFLCISIVRPLEPSRMDTGLPMLLENVEHHLRMGFTHIFIGLYLDRKSVHMQRYRLALDPWVSAGLVSIMAIYLPGYDDVAGFLGAVFIDDYVRYIHQISCLYLSKGVAHYTAFFHSSEFLTFHQDIVHVQGLLNIPNFSKKNPCYFIIQSLGVPDPKGLKTEFGPGNP